MHYFRSTTHCFPINSKVATNAIAAAIVMRDAPHKLDFVLEKSPYMYRTMVDHVDFPDLPCLMLVRHPEERFLSALAMVNLDPQVAIDALVNGGELLNEMHYIRQSDFIDDAKKHGQPITCFKFPDQVKEFCEAAGFAYPWETINESAYPKAKLTSDQKKFVADYYADDFALFNSLG